MIAATALIVHVFAAEVSFESENQGTCLLQLQKTNEVMASKRPIHPYQVYEKKENLLCGMGVGCKIDVEGNEVPKKIDVLYRSTRRAGAATQSQKVEIFDDSSCEEVCNAKADCAGFLLSASHTDYSCSFFDDESINCVGTLTPDLTSDYTCFKKTAGLGKYRAHQNRQYDRYDMASQFDYAYQPASCEIDPSSSAQELVDQINTIREVLDYRVSDVIREKGYYWLPSRQNLMDERYRGTALQSLLKRCSDLGSCHVSIEDFAEELASIGEAKSFSKPSNETIVAYIRAGDIIDFGVMVGKKLRDSAIMEGIRRALEAGYQQLAFVVVEAYADRAYQKDGLFMYSESKHEANRKQLLAAVRGLHEFLCEGTPQISFGVVSPVSADETLFYLMHASMLVTDGDHAGGFNWVGRSLAQLHRKDTVIM
jgi:hypothetical protein